MDDAMLMPASDSSLAWVYEGATPAMTPDDAATAIRAATIGWTRDDHLQMGALQHHLAVALCDDPERQAVCSAAAFMHVAAAGMDPGSLLGKSLDPKLLRPKLGTKPQRIGTTRSGKPIYNMFTHPAHASFKTADHVDHIKAMEAHSKGKKMNKAGGEGSRGGKVIGHTNGKPIYAATTNRHAGMQTHPKGMGQHVIEKNPTFTATDHLSAAAHHERVAKKINSKPYDGSRHSDVSFGKYARNVDTAKAHREAAEIVQSRPPVGSLSVKTSPGIRVAASNKTKNLKHSFSGTRPGVVMHKSEAVSILENFLAKSSASVLGRTSSGKAVHPAGHPSYSKMHSLNTMASGPKKRVGMQDAIRSTLRAHGGYTAKDHSEAGALHEKAGNIHLAEMHNIASGFLGASKKSMSKSGEGSRGGKVIGHTKSGSGKPIYASSRTHASSASFSAKDHADAADAHMAAAGVVSQKPMTDGNKKIYNGHRMAHQFHMEAARSGASSASQVVAKKTKADGSSHIKPGTPFKLMKKKNHDWDAAISDPSKWNGHVAEDKKVDQENARRLIAAHPNMTAEQHKKRGSDLAYSRGRGSKADNALGDAHHAAAELLSAKNDNMHKKSMSKSDIMGMPVNLGDMQGSPIDGSYVDIMGGSHDLFMQQAELANCPTMWAPIAAVSDSSSPN